MKVLYFDLEHGSQTLGGPEMLKTLFGHHMLAPSTWDAFQNILKSLYTHKETIITKKIGPVEVKEESIRITPKTGVEIDAFVIDTFSELSKKFQRSLVNKKTGTMKLQDWGVLKHKLDGCLDYISRIPGIVVCNCHGKLQTMDDGNNKIIPYIDGSTKEDIAKWFDFVFYTTTELSLNGEPKYFWHTGRTEKYDHAKDRTQLLPIKIPQDYQLPIKAAKERGFEGCKILIIGSPGSGKTYALQTLVTATKKKLAPVDPKDLVSNVVETNNQVTQTTNGVNV